MMSLHTWLAYFVVMTVIAYTPGPMTMFSMSSSVRYGFQRTLPAIVGGSSAYITQMIVVYLGLGAIVQQSTLVFNAIKWVGVAYLLFLAVKVWRTKPADTQAEHGGVCISAWRQYCLGYATGMSNPKSVLVFTVVFPQFINPQHYTADFLVLATSFFMIQGSSAMAYAVFGARVFHWMRQRALMHVQNRVTAVVLFLAGGMLAVSRR